jgi:hypothetical protein
VDNNNDLFNLSIQYFQTLTGEFARYGLVVRPDLELRPSEGLLCYYNLNDGHIYMSLPDTTTPRGKLQLILLRSMFNCETNNEVFRFLHLISYWLIAHEMAHHFRHANGMFGNNLWQEEHIANQLAIAVVKRCMSPQERAECKWFLQRALRGLSEKIGAENLGNDSYYSLLYSLNASGTIDDETLHDIEIMQKLLAASSEDMLTNILQLPMGVIERIQKRQILIDDINNQGNKDLVRYLYYYLSWMNLGLAGRETCFISEFAQQYLNQKIDLLPPNNTNTHPANTEIMACFRAYQDTLKHSKPISTYFYKRYRTLLVNKIKATNTLRLADDNATHQMYQFLEHWNYQGVDPLVYIFNMVTPELRSLFPQCASPDESVYLYLSDTDKRLKDHIFFQTDDLAAANSVQRLELFSKVEFYDLLSSEGLLRLIGSIYSVKLAAGETLIWQEDNDTDVFILIDGKLNVLVGKGDNPKSVRVLYPGQVVGEIAYFAHTERTATVRALEDSECFAMKYSDLYLFCKEQPTFTLQMANYMAKRFRQKLQTE